VRRTPGPSPDKCSDRKSRRRIDLGTPSRRRRTAAASREAPRSRSCTCPPILRRRTPGIVRGTPCCSTRRPRTG
jgi:hypothetical protein